MKFFIKNKRGEGDLLSSETVKLIFSVMAIAVLFALAGSMFYMFIKGTDIRKAEATLEEVIRMMDNLDEGETGNVLLLNPKDWFIFYSENGEWEKDGSKLTSLDDCERNCLCVCEAQSEGNVIIGGQMGAPVYGSEVYRVVDCNKVGICKSLGDKKIKLTENIQKGKRIDVSNLGISLEDNFFVFE